MNSLLLELHEWMGGKEDEHLEFKEAKNGLHYELLVKYCVARANEGGRETHPRCHEQETPQGCG